MLTVSAHFISPKHIQWFMEVQ